MNLSNLKYASGSVHKDKRIGRGQGSGHGQSSGRGTKGQKAVSGYNRRPGFEGGQQPLQRRLPKFGFSNPHRKEFKAINLYVLQKLATEHQITEYDIPVYRKFGLVSGDKAVKILGKGNIESKLIVKAHGFSKTAKAAIEAKGGSAVILK